MIDIQKNSHQDTVYDQCVFTHSVITVDVWSVCADSWSRVPVFLPRWTDPGPGCVEEIPPHGHNISRPWVTQMSTPGHVLHMFAHILTHTDTITVCLCSPGSIRVFDFLAKKELTTIRFSQGGTCLSWAPTLVSVLVWECIMLPQMIVFWQKTDLCGSVGFF